MICLSNDRFKKRTNGRNVPDIADDEDEIDNDDLELLNNEIDLEPLEHDPVCSKDFERKTYKLKSNLGYVETREKLKIIRYRRYDIDQCPEDYFREQIMLFKPWSDEHKEVEVENTRQAYKAHADVIAKNRSKFENLLRNESQAEALERMEKEISDQEDLEYAMEVAKKNRIDDILMGREVGFNKFAKTFFTANRISPMFKRSA